MSNPGDFNKAKSLVLNKLKKELPKELTYHSPAHTKDVLNSAIQIAGQEGVNGEDLHVLKTAALFHDSGFLFGLKHHEELSCDFAKNVLPEFDYTSSQIEAICSMIQATQIPQDPKTHLAEILCDADLDYLGRDDFWEISDLLFREFKFLNVVENEEEWNRLQIRFFESHQYFTDTAIEMRKQKKEQHLAQIRKLVAKG